MSRKKLSFYDVLYTALYNGPDKDPSLSPSDVIVSLFRHTNKKSGLLIIPEWPCGITVHDPERFYQCRMNWNSGDLAKVLQNYQTLYDNLKKLSENWDNLLAGIGVDALPKDLKKVWDTYIRDFNGDGIGNTEQMAELLDKYETTSKTTKIRSKLENHKEISEEEAAFYNAFKATGFTASELKLFLRYLQTVEDAKRRVGDAPAAVEVVLHARRLCHIMHLGGPDVVIDNEARLLAQAMVIHAYCSDMETVEGAE